MKIIYKALPFGEGWVGLSIVDEYKPAGSYAIEWVASNYPSGVYFYQLKADSFVETKKMVLIK